LCVGHLAEFECTSLDSCVIGHFAEFVTYNTHNSLER
jgi:hypothetical protein